MTGGYRGLQGLQRVTWGDKGLQGVTAGYKGLQGVTRVTEGYKGLQGVTRGDRVTKDFRNFVLTRKYPDTFSWSILHINQSSRNLKFLTKTMD